MKLYNTYKIKGINKKSSMPPLKDAVVGDIIYFEVPMEGRGYGSHGCYSTHLKIKNMRTGTEHTTTLNAFNYVREHGYEWEEVEK